MPDSAEKLGQATGAAGGENRRKGTLGCRFLYIPASYADNKKIGSTVNVRGRCN